MTNINVCARKDTPVVGTESFPCGATGRFVVIINAVRTLLTLCEVEVYGMYYIELLLIEVDEFNNLASRIISVENISRCHFRLP